MSGTVRTISQLLAQFASGGAAGNIGPDDEQDFIATMNDLTSSKIVPNTQSASYTFGLVDIARFTLMNVAGANNLTIPPNSTVPFPVGQILPFAQIGAGATTIVAGAGVTVHQPTGLTLVLSQYFSGFAYQYAANTWLLSL